MLESQVEANTLSHHVAISACDTGHGRQRAGLMLESQIEAYTIRHYAAISASDKGQ